MDKIGQGPPRGRSDPFEPRNPLAQLKPGDPAVDVPCLTAEELIQAENLVLRMVQEEAFPELMEAVAAEGDATRDRVPLELCQLRPQMDKGSGLFRVTGRIGLAFEAEESAPPILIPAKHHVTDLLIWRAHQQVMHSGGRVTLTQLKDTYWILRGRQQVKRVLFGCATCKRRNARAFDEAPAALPLGRVLEAEPFQHTGVDFAGPLYVKPLDRQEEGDDTEPPMEKCYVALFTCAVTRAVHLELVANLSAEEFLSALRAFFGRRGIPSLIYSDNAPTFKQVSRYLQALHSDPKVHDYLSVHRVK